MKQTGIIRTRLLILLGCVGVYFLALMIRLGYLQLWVSTEYLNRAMDIQWTRNMPIEGQRGVIMDRNGQIIVNNIVAPSVVVLPRQVTEPQRAAEVLAEVLGTTFEDALGHVTKKVAVERIQPEGRKLDHDQVVAIKEAGLAGVFLVNDVRRNYPHGSLLAHTLGFTGIDNQGITGLEYYYNNLLMGQKGAWEIVSDNKGRPLSNFADIYAPSSRGYDMVTTIDLRLQEIMEREADNAMARFNPDSILMLAMEPATGNILGMVSRPGFEPWNYQAYPQEVYNRNLPIFMAFEPGSTAKIMTFAAALEESLMTLETPFHCSGYSIIAGRRIRDWKTSGHGAQTMLDVIKNSCNPGFMHMGVDLLGKDRLFQYLEAFGLMEKTGVEMLGESKGIVFNPEVISDVEVATTAFGQGNSMTPLQLVTAVSAAVNGGNLMRPHIIDQIVHPYTGEIIAQNTPEIRRRVISEETSATMRFALENVGAQGSGRNSFIPGFRIGGKTGTAQKPNPNGGGYLSGEYILSFISAAPMDDPEIVLYVAIDNPRTPVQYGGVVAAPIAKAVLEEALPALGVQRRTEQIEKLYAWHEAVPVEVFDYMGMRREDIGTTPDYKIEILGSGSRVIAQQPVGGTKVNMGSTIRLFMGH